MGDFRSRLFARVLETWGKNFSILEDSLQDKLATFCTKVKKSSSNTRKRIAFWSLPLGIRNTVYFYKGVSGGNTFNLNL